MGSDDPKTTVTSILATAGKGGDRRVLDRLLPLVYDQLRGMARGLRSREMRRPTLATTALVHEAYVKLVDAAQIPVRNRSYFFAAASRAMRQILVDAARRRRRLKRGGGHEIEPLSDRTPDQGAESFAGTLLELNDALEQMQEHYPAAARVVECRYFGGLSVVETAAALERSPRSVKRDWAFARAWLFQRMSDSDEPGNGDG